MNSNRDRSYSPGIRYENGTNEYQVRVSRSYWKWLWLLLLLLLFIRCERTIEVTTLDDVTSDPVEDVYVGLDYKAHFLYKDGFFTSEYVHRQEQTDSEGKAVFEKLPCSVFSYIFYTLSKVHLTATTPCYEDAKADRYFHWCFSHTFRLKRKLTDLVVTVVDKETSEPLVNATVGLKYNYNGKMVSDSLTTDANGRVNIKNFWECGIIEELRGSCYGYADTVKYNVPARDLKEIGPASTLRLRPLKLSFDFFVHDVETKEPIPMALATVTLTNPDKSSSKGTTRTNVDGKGRGFYDNGFVLATIGIEASKQHYYDSILVGTYTVEQFVKLPREKRTVWLRPKPYMVEFENVDSITGDPIPGVRNQIRVTDPSGAVEEFEELSNSNGKFPVCAKEGSKIEIISSKEEEYETKETLIESFEEGDKIPMVPITIYCSVDIVFCIDNTGSMGGVISTVKNNAMSFHQDLTQYCKKYRREIEHLRLKVVSFGDLVEAAFVQSEMYDMPDQRSKFNSFLTTMKMTHGKDSEEDGLEALAMAIKDTPWDASAERTRNIIVLYTDAEAHPLETFSRKPYRPAGLPQNMTQLSDLWGTMDPVARRLVLFAPEASYWNQISSSWDGVYHKPFTSSLPYNDILDAICKSL